MTDRFYAGTRGWFGAAVNVAEQQTSKEAMQLAGLDWRVDKRPLYTTGAEGIPTVLMHQVATVRDDKDTPLGIVGPGFQPIQNSECFEFMDALVGEGATYDSAGTIKGGSSIFITAKLPGTVEIGEGDELEKYLILHNGHDGFAGFRCFWSPMRLACTNMLNASFEGAKVSIEMRHTRLIRDRMGIAKTIMAAGLEYYEVLTDQFRKLRSIPLTQEGLLDLLIKILPDDPKAKSSPRIGAYRKQIVKNFHYGRGADLAGSTLWGAYNAVTEWTTHQREYRGADERHAAENRFTSLIQGDASRIQQRAFREVIALAN